jgi:hypothetical protein
MRVLILLLLPVLISIPQHAGAVDLARLVQLCGRGQCENAMNGELRRIARTQARAELREEEFGLIALALYTVARHREARPVRRRVAIALSRLAAATLNPDQARLFRSVSEAIRSGDVELFDLENPFSVSPS